jgi:hypothetical protein
MLKDSYRPAARLFFKSKFFEYNKKLTLVKISNNNYGLKKAG